MNISLLVINTGSSSIKFALYRVADHMVQPVADAAGLLDGIGSRSNFTVHGPDGRVLHSRCLTDCETMHHAGAFAVILDWLRDYLADGTLLGVGHRVVHGGLHYSAPVGVDAKVLSDLEALIPLAPLHQPHNLAAIRILQEMMPSLPQVVCFDTAFHRTQPPVAQRFAIPRHFFDEGIRRYGFHGLSYEYITSVLPALDPGLTAARVIIAHLGNGASLCALRNGRSIATTMGFSTLDGLVMGSRGGNLDPGVLLYLMAYHHMDAKMLEQLLYHQSGLLGVSGFANDMRTLLASSDPHAQEAVELFVYRIGRELGSLTAALGGLDALVFTGGIGEHSAPIRAKVCQQAAWLGLELDEMANNSSATRISTPSSGLSAWVVATDENLMIARHSLRLIGNG